MRCWLRQWRRLKLTLSYGDNENTNSGPKVTRFIYKCYLCNAGYTEQVSSATKCLVCILSVINLNLRQDVLWILYGFSLFHEIVSNHFHPQPFQFTVFEYKHNQAGWHSDTFGCCDRIFVIFLPLQVNAEILL